MSITDLQKHRTRPRAARTGLFLLVTVVAVVVGLLGMHTFMTTMGAHDETPSTVRVMDEPAGVSHSPIMSSVGCAGPCNPDHSMMMACILALLAGVIVLFASRHRELTEHAGGPQPRQPSLTQLAALSPIRPPNLIALSISRT